MQQLEVINDDQPNPVPPFKPARARPQRRNREAGRVIDEQRQCFKLTCRAREIAEILLADLAHTQTFRADPRIFGKDTRRELISRHFEAEKRDLCTHRFLRRYPVFLITQPASRGIIGDVGG